MEGVASGADARVCWSRMPSRCAWRRSPNCWRHWSPHDGAPRRCWRRPARPARSARSRRFCSETARIAVGCLHTELILYPKPGLVSLVDNGSHTDMTAATFMRSMFALRHYFARICRAGFDDAPFAVLKQLGIEAEARMLRATGGINTHRGAIFSLGMLCAAIGRAHAQGMAPTADGLRAIMLIRWGEELAAHTRPAGAESHGSQVADLHAASGAREEGALGLPSVFEVGLPAMRRTLAAGRSMHHARIDALFALMAHVSDTNVFYRGGAARRVDREAPGGRVSSTWAAPRIRNGAATRSNATASWSPQKLSPGGAADLLAATCLVHAVTGAVVSARLLLLCPGQGGQHAAMFDLARTDAGAAALLDECGLPPSIRRRCSRTALRSP